MTNDDLRALLAEAKIALSALVTMSDRGPQPSKFDEALSWRDNDTRARQLADAAIARITAALAEKEGGDKPVYQQMIEGGYTIAVFKDGKLLAADADVYQPPLPKGD